MKKLTFATNNSHKLQEVSQILAGVMQVGSLSDIACTDDIPETGDTLEDNALQKARYVYEKFGVDCFADDTGLEVESLNGEPGVYSARYAGESKSDTANMQKLLQNLQGISNRKARFRTVIALILEGKEYIFAGEIRGNITETRSGTNGFGYDPIFQPEGFDRTFAELTSEEKNSISHRARATEQMLLFLKNHLQENYK
jgi:XTP/dITP diphosphohydrolase